MNKFKKMLVAGLVCTTAITGGLCLTGCGNTDNNSGETEIHKIYDKAVAAGYEGTYEEWLASIKGEKGDKGEAGKKVELNVSSTHIQWRYEGDAEWTDLIALDDLKTGVKGDKGDTGAQGEKGDKGDKGDTGATGAQGIQGEKGEKGDKGDTGLAGADGKQVEFNVTETHIQWRYEGETNWTDLIALSELKGSKGDKGDTGATGAQGIQGEKGDKGDKGDTGAQGEKGDKGDKGETGATGAQGIQGDKGDAGQNGKSAYEIYCGYKVNYEGSETDWLNDMISGKLVLVATKDFGDVNGDGVVTSKDLIRLSKYLKGTLEEGETVNLAVADVDLSGNVDERDLDILSKSLSDWDISLPITYKWGDVNMDGKVDETDYNLVKDDTSYNKFTDLQRVLASCGRDYTREQSLKTYEAYLNNNLPSINFVWGDVNGDGVRNSRDIVRLSKYLAGYDVEINLALADLDLNDKVDEADLTLLRKTCIGGYGISLPLMYQWGDVNMDGTVNQQDTVLLQQYLTDNNTQINLALADVDLNDEINEADVELLRKYVVGGYNITLPVIYQSGDVNMDGTINQQDTVLLQQYLADNNTKINLALADLDLNGEINKADVELLRKYVAGGYDITLPITYQWGDVNGDGEVTSKDLVRLSKYLKGTLEEGETVNLAVADLDLNGEIDERDLDVLAKSFSDWDVTLPLLYQWGDVNMDGKVDETDYNLLNSEESYNELTQLQKYLGTFGYDYEREEAVTLFRQYLDGEIDTMAPATEE